MTHHAQLAQACAEYSLDPLGFVRFAFPWGSGELADATGPREWQEDVLRDIGARLKAGYKTGDVLMPVLKAVASGHGVGKSALVSWLIAWGLCTCEDTKIVITANTDDQMRKKTWPEVAKWFRLLITQRIEPPLFVVRGESIQSTQANHDKTWRADLATWSENNLEAFAGLHNKGKRIILIFDEASGIVDRVWEVAEGALTDEDTEIVWCAFGNPTQPTGRFFEAIEGRQRYRWHPMQIDSRTVPGTNNKLFDEWATIYGEDSDFFRVRVRGMFPRSGASQFISPALVEEAVNRNIEIPDSYVHDPLIIGVDVARQGDDQTVIVFRKGRDANVIPMIKMREPDLMQVAARVAHEVQRFKADAVMVDGTGIGAGVVDKLREMRVQGLFDVQGAAKPSNDTRDGIKYANKRAEMWGNMRDWLKGGRIPDDNDLRTDLTGPEYGFRTVDGSLLLERKEDMKRRGLASPDCFVAGTMVATPAGERAIEMLKAGDLVLTPFGPTPILGAWSKPAESLTTVRFSSGHALTGTGRHKVFCWGKGETRLDALTLTDRMEPLSKRRLLAWRMLSLLCIGGRDSEFRLLVAITSQAGRTSPSGFFIAVCGLTATGLSQAAAKYITKMVIGVTTPLKIWSLCQVPRIAVCTCESGFPTQEANQKTTGLCSAPALLRPNGIDQKPDAPGIENMGKKHGKVESQFRPSANGVVQNILHSFPRVLVSVLRLVCKQSRSEPILPKKEHALSVAKLSKQTGIGKRAVAPVSVQTENVSPTPVFNLTLAKHNAYYANGVLVFNCADALALTFAYPVASNAFAGGPQHLIRNQQQRRFDPHAVLGR